MKNTSALFLVLAAGLVGCSDSTGPGTVGESGSVTFTYTGAGASSATSYNATGAIPVNVVTGFGSSAWAAGGIGTNEVDILAVVPKGGNRWDVTSIVIGRTSIGTSTIDFSCSANNCTRIDVLFGSNQNETNYTESCQITTGSVTITAITASTISGNFSGSGTCNNAATGNDTPFTITNGAFSVGVTTQL